MDTHDGTDSNVQGSSGGGPFPHPDWAGGSDAGSGPRSGRRTIIGRLARDWWRILLVWVLVSTPMTYLIYMLVEPTFEATSLLQVAPNVVDLFSPAVTRGTTAPEEVKPNLLTQVQLITCDAVLDAALSLPAIGNLPMIRSSKDPRATLRADLRVEIVGDNTHLIRVTLVSGDPNEAAAIVNAVVDAYLDQHNKYNLIRDRSQKTHLKTELDKLQHQIEKQQYEMAKLVEDENVPSYTLRSTDAADENAGATVEPSLQTVTAEQSNRMADRLIAADFELMDVRARLEAARLAKDAPVSAEKLRELETTVEAAKQKALAYKRYIAQVRARTAGARQLQVAMLKEDLAYLKRSQEMVKQKLTQLEFEFSQETYRVTVQDRASAPKTPSNNRRLVSTAAAPVGVLFLILGLFLVRELRATRVAAPEAMS